MGGGISRGIESFKREGTIEREQESFTRENRKRENCERERKFQEDD